MSQRLLKPPRTRFLSTFLLKVDTFEILVLTVDNQFSNIFSKISQMALQY